MSIKIYLKLSIEDLKLLTLIDHVRINLYDGIYLYKEATINKSRGMINIPIQPSGPKLVSTLYFDLHNLELLQDCVSIEHFLKNYNISHNKYIRRYLVTEIYPDLKYYILMNSL